MGLSRETLKLSFGSKLSRLGREILVGQADQSNRYTISWDDPDLKNQDLGDGDVWLQWSEVFRSTHPSELSFPLVFECLDEITNRQLTVSWGCNSHSLELYSQRLLGLKLFCLTQSPPIEVNTMAKVWNDSPHGTVPRSRYERIDNTYVQLNGLKAANNNPDELNEIGHITAGFTWEVFFHSEADQDVLVFPIADLEIAYDDRSGLEKAADILAANGFSGSLIRSGEYTHYFGDFLLPSTESARIIGTLIKILTPDTETEIHFYADRLIKSESIEETQQIANEILQEYPSGAHTESLLDLRWAAHTFTHNKGHAGLRCLDAKRNGFNPYEIGRIF